MRNPYKCLILLESTDRSIIGLKLTSPNCKLLILLIYPERSIKEGLRSVIIFDECFDCTTARMWSGFIDLFGVRALGYGVIFCG
jgi:hypothetical protein